MQSTPGDLLTLAILLFTTATVILAFFSYYFNKASPKAKREFFLRKSGVPITIVFISGFVLTFTFSCFTMISCALSTIKGSGLICGNIFYWIALGITIVMSAGLYLGLRICWKIIRVKVESSDVEATRRDEPLGEKDNNKVESSDVEATREAERLSSLTGGGEVRIHGEDGKIRDSDTVKPAHDPNPPKDKKN